MPRRRIKTACGTAGILGVEKLYIVRYNIRCIFALSIAAVIAAHLNTSFDADTAALGQVVSANFSKFFPTGHRDKIRCLLSLLLCCPRKAAVYRNRKAAKSLSALCIANLWIARKAPDQYNSVHCFLSPV